MVLNDSQQRTYEVSVSNLTQNGTGPVGTVPHPRTKTDLVEDGEFPVLHKAANPHSRRQRAIFNRYLKRELLKANEEGVRVIERMSAAITRAAMDGDVRAYEVCRDTVDGKPTSDDVAAAPVIMVNATYMGVKD
jgi:hypothetical protein